MKSEDKVKNCEPEATYIHNEMPSSRIIIMDRLPEGQVLRTIEIETKAPDIDASINSLIFLYDLIKKNESTSKQSVGSELINNNAVG